MCCRLARHICWQLRADKSNSGLNKPTLDRADFFMRMRKHGPAHLARGELCQSSGVVGAEQAEHRLFQSARFPDVVAARERAGKAAAATPKHRPLSAAAGGDDAIKVF